MRHRSYDDCDGPPRDPSHSLETWHADQDKADAAQAAAETRAIRVLPDLYDVADTVLEPLMGEKLRAVPRRLGTAARDAVEARGEKATRPKLRLEAARILAQERAAADPELAVALLLRAALLFQPPGGWSRRAPRRDQREGFGSLAALLGAAFSELTIGVAPLSLEVAQNRARTRSLDHEVFVQASRGGTSRARNVDAVERRTDAQALILRSEVDLRLLPLLFERHVLGRYATRLALLDELRHREAAHRRIDLPVRPARWGFVTLGHRRDGSPIVVPRDAPAGLSTAEIDQADQEEATWQRAVDVLLWGEQSETCYRDAARALVRPVEVAEDILYAAIGMPRRVTRRPARRSLSHDMPAPALPSSAGEVLAGG